jgi:CYTH domain-containing protein
MAYEIERKYLVQDESWRALASTPAFIRQAYLARNGTVSTSKAL